MQARRAGCVLDYLTWAYAALLLCCCGHLTIASDDCGTGRSCTCTARIRTRLNGQLRPLLISEVCDAYNVMHSADQHVLNLTQKRLQQVLQGVPDQVGLAVLFQLC